MSESSESSELSASGSEPSAARGVGRAPGAAPPQQRIEDLHLHSENRLDLCGPLAVAAGNLHGVDKNPPDTWGETRVFENLLAPLDLEHR